MERGHEEPFPFRGRQTRVCVFFGRLGKSLKGFEWQHDKITAGLEEGCMQLRVFPVPSLKGALGVW